MGGGWCGEGGMGMGEVDGSMGRGLWRGMGIDRG